MRGLGRIAAAWACGVLGLTMAASGAPPVRAATFPSQVSIPNTQVIDFKSKINGHRYSISVAMPLEPKPPKGGYPVLYVIDGYAYFASAVEATRGNGNATDVVVVGIGYPHDEAYARRMIASHGPLPPSLAAYKRFGLSRLMPSSERMYDLTLPATVAELAAQGRPGPSQKASDVGGLDDFLKMIETDVKPRVAALAPINPANQALFGHSLGGLAVLHALFVEPNAFRTFIVASPSIWWNQREVLKDEPAFDAAVNAGKASPRVLVTIGSEESDVPKLPPNSGFTPEVLKKLIDNSRMVENARELTAHLKDLHGAPPYEVADYAVFDHQDHGISVWPALGRGVAFAFPH